MTYLKMALTYGPWALALVFAVLYWGAGKDADLLRTERDDLAIHLTAANNSLASYVTAVSSRDATILQQNASIDALSAASQQHRADYEAALWAAQQRADVNRGRASELLALTAPDGELAQCRAARDLLETEMVR